MNDPTHKTGFSAKKIELRNRIIDELRKLKTGRINEKKIIVAEKLGITKRWLNMALNLTPHWSHEKTKKKQRKKIRERGARPSARR